MNNDRFKFRHLNKCQDCGFEAYYESCWNGNDFEDTSILLFCPKCQCPDWEQIGELQQSTGLRDKNGKLIFEGDVIRDKIVRTFIVRYIYDDLCWYLEENTTPQIINGFQLQKSLLGIKDIEIVGNINEKQ